jgi:hypothetical protein
MADPWIFEATDTLDFDVTRWRHFHPPCTVLPHKRPKIDCTSPEGEELVLRSVPRIDMNASHTLPPLY